jgi:hypothetical protein
MVEEHPSSEESHKKKITIFVIGKYGAVLPNATYTY